MKVALVHDYLNQFGGAERVLETLTEIFPKAPIYSIFYDERLLNGRFKDKIVKTSFLDHPIVRRNHRFFIPLLARAAESINLGDEYDLIISDSAGFGKGVTYKRGIHIAYIHTPLRYAWEPEMYLETLFPRFLIKAASPIITYLRNWDKKVSERPDVLLANSNFTAQKIKKFYDREAIILYPPVNTDVFYPEPGVKENENGYFLAFGRIVHFKRFDLIVQAFNELDVSLKIVGSGPEEKNIKKLIDSPNIIMIPEVKDENALRRIVTGAKAVIFPQVEDFGLVAAESLSCGTPVIAYSEGGATEIVKDGKNGLHFHKQTPEDLKRAILKFQRMKFSKAEIVKSAQKFSKDSFKKNLNKIISQHF